MIQKPTRRDTVDMTNELKAEIQEMADERNWSFSYMSYVLLQQAVKEKNRKKKKVHSESSNNI